MVEKLLLCNPRGSCAGVKRAVDGLWDYINNNSETVYVLHEIVHNKHELNMLKDAGVIFIESILDVPKNSTLFFSAHGVGLDIEKQAIEKNLNIIDATCPIVKSAHKNIVKYANNGYVVFIIGNSLHPELVGMIGQIKDISDCCYHIISSTSDIHSIIDAYPHRLKEENNFAYISQSTLCMEFVNNIVSELKLAFPKIENCNSIESHTVCYATSNRQYALRSICKDVDFIIVVGSKNSSNSISLFNIAKSEKGANAILIDFPHDLCLNTLNDKRIIGITGGASVSEKLIQSIVDKIINEYPDCKIEESVGKNENVYFKKIKSMSSNR